MKINEREYTSFFGKYIERRFEKVGSVEVRVVGGGYDSDEARDWVYLGVDHKSNFFLNGNKNLNFFLVLEFPREAGLKERIEKNSKSGREIDKASLFLTRPHREYMNGQEKKLEKNSFFEKYVKDPKKIKINPEKDYYFICCRIKRIPKNPKNLCDNLWGYLIKIPVGTTTGFI